MIRALTGIDAGRLPEEKRRGMTIDLGFAYGALPDGTKIGFVDVPGHERFCPTCWPGFCRSTGCC
jgi:selenocysteine-specific elongation factor